MFSEWTATMLKSSPSLVYMDPPANLTSVASLLHMNRWICCRLTNINKNSYIRKTRLYVNTFAQSNENKIVSKKMPELWVSFREMSSISISFWVSEWATSIANNKRASHSVAYLTSVALFRASPSSPYRLPHDLTVFQNEFDFAASWLFNLESTRSW